MNKRLNILAVALLSSFIIGQSEENKSQVKVTKMNDSFYLVESTGAFPVNSLVFSGEDGLLIVDSGFQQTSKEFKEKISKIGSGKVKYIINTHNHPDHYGGNTMWSGEATIIIHEKALGAISGAYYGLTPLSDPDDIPQIALTDGMNLNLEFNNQIVQIRPIAGGHTHNDLLVYFKDSKIACMGGLLYSDQFPAVITGGGGNAEKFIQIHKSLLDSWPKDVTIIAGHGPVLSKSEFKDYHKMITKSYQLVNTALSSGESVDNVVDKDLLKDFHEWGDGPITSTRSWTTVIDRGLNPVEPSGLKSIAERMTNVYMEDGLKTAIKEYKKLKLENSGEYQFNEFELNMLGYHLSYRDKWDDAIKIFKLNISEYPESVNPYDSIGEAYMNRGDKKKAIKYFKKALEIDPEYPSSLAALEKLRSNI
ncbi:MAG: MBL fold metallo-hydrolase [Candidatus Marinimicrobia bacterium]|jgi:glyoxylase-like metal-dependent hydrolase (beta-lactamase superfamily II)|nr:MBL fold metallo-hydrolase [Candidatus Neomarinimicrobiota bacterium]MBT3632852.1 MBL fold metallo-hydrolase [Candidatus Neomarinimicrobiota bacterium]MBT3681962.1 MBL fold metallo-hydrolase [Candidatus Neomarinimicrobiota bacterium]MBT3759009.1 MBL fold metallo-hydrolase [Candidatus Neomarinimicrobiota bacterium]MBT3895092.1 MBL fold metallo-hydrolase [Candidatus Neomarinimicrobiota bacterium]